MTLNVVIVAVPIVQFTLPVKEYMFESSSWNSLANGLIRQMLWQLTAVFFSDSGLHVVCVFPQV